MRSEKIAQTQCDYAQPRIAVQNRTTWRRIKSAAKSLYDKRQRNHKVHRSREWRVMRVMRAKTNVKPTSGKTCRGPAYLIFHAEAHFRGARGVARYEESMQTCVQHSAGCPEPCRYRQALLRARAGAHALPRAARNVPFTDHVTASRWDPCARR